MLSARGSAADERRGLLVDDEPTLHNFVDYVEHGTSADKDPEHPESSESRKARVKLIRATAICFVFMLVEIVGGYLAGSLAIMTDAAHLLSDVAGFCVSLFALYLGERKPTLTLSYGFKRAEIIGAILSVMLIWFLTGILLWEAVLRTQGIVNNTRGSVVDGKIMFIVAAFGLCANMTLLLVLGHDHSHGVGGGHGHSHGSESSEAAHSHSHGESHAHSHGESHAHSHGGKTHDGHDDHSDHDDHDDHDDHSGHDHGHGHGHGAARDAEAGLFLKPAKKTPAKHKNINVSAAYVHAIGDLIQSAGVCVAGGLIWAFPAPEYRLMQLADPIVTFMFSILVLYSTYEILSTSLNVLMEGVPAGINPREVAQALASIPNVVGVHHLHIWAITVGAPSLSVHLVVTRGADLEFTLQRAQHVLRTHNIDHSTVQCEVDNKEVCSNGDCVGTPCNAYAISCTDNGNCFDDFRIEQGSYGSTARTGPITNGNPFSRRE